MTLKVYDKGEPVRIEAVFLNAALVETDPSTVHLKVRTPAGVETVYAYGVDVALVKASAANYYADITCSEIGDWWYQWDGTGPVIATEPGLFHVRGSGF
jgi:hypothetical protein